jgi:hypothetical protein
MKRCNSKDVTDFARSLGYQAIKPVLVQDGLVVSHRNAEWFTFCNQLRDTNSTIEQHSV